MILSIQASVKTQTIHIERHTLDSFEKKFRNRNMLKAKTVFLYFFVSPGSTLLPFHGLKNHRHEVTNEKSYFKSRLENNKTTRERDREKRVCVCMHEIEYERKIACRRVKPMNDR